MAFVLYKEFPLLRHVEDPFEIPNIPKGATVMARIKPAKEDEAMVIYHVDFDVEPDTWEFLYQHPETSIHPIRLEEILITRGHPIVPPVSVTFDKPFGLSLRNLSEFVQTFYGVMWYMIGDKETVEQYRKWQLKQAGKMRT